MLQLGSKVAVDDSLVLQPTSTCSKDVFQMWIWVHYSELLDDLWQVVGVDGTLLLEVVVLHDVIESLLAVLHRLPKLLEECLLDLLHHLA